MRRRPQNVHVATAVFLGGACGTLARAGISELLPAGGPGFPWATLLVNLAGAALLGWSTIALTGHRVRRQLVGTGFCGGLTTFSTFQLELYRIADGDHVWRALLYAATSVGLGVLAAIAGRRLAR